jgi:hypothetical protein
LIRRHITNTAAILGTLISMLGASHGDPVQPTSMTASSEPSLVEVYWGSSRSVVVPGITNVVVLDDQITRAEVTEDSIQFFGLERGETVAIGFRNGGPVSMRVRVLDKPVVAIPPSLMQLQAEMAQGSVSTTAETASGGGVNSFAMLNGFSWSQPMGLNGHFDFNSQIEDNTFADGHAFNVRQASAVYQSPGIDVRALDFTVNLTSGGAQPLMGPFSYYDAIELRGASVSLRQGANQYTVFGGSTVPFFYLTLGSTRDVAGFSFDRQQTGKLEFFANTTFVDAPLDFFGLDSARRNNFMQTAGMTYRLDEKWAIRTTGGISNHGALARGEISYTGHRMTAFAAGTSSPPLFPLNQLESLFSGTASLKTGWTFRSHDWLTESLYYQHTTTQAIAGITHAGSSDYLSPGLWFRFARHQTANFTYTYSHNEGGFASAPSTGNRFDTTWQYQITPRVSNSAEVTVGSLQDPLQLNSEDEFAVRDAVSFPVKSGNMFVAFEHDQTNPSLVQKLNEELSLLSPALQTLFLQDPVSFVNSPNLPPDIRALLGAQQPVNTSISAAGQFNLGPRLMLSPNVSVARTTNGSTESWAPFFGYGLMYQLRPTLQLNSSLSNVWVLVPSQPEVQRTTVFSLGVAKRFTAPPTSFLPGHHERIIEGRVFRDNNVTGIFDREDPGFAGLQVQLENGQSVLTDSEGRFKFTGVDAGRHQVSLALTQFRDPVRMTTTGEYDVDLIRERFAVVNFGIVNFARVVGNVFNDLRFEDKRQPDSKGLPEIRLILDNGQEKRTVSTNGSGDYKLDDVLPGDYSLTLDSTSVPANYAVSQETFQVHVAPISTLTRDVPVRALRSISGRVFLRISTLAAGPTADPEETKLVPLADAQITAGYGIAKTDKDGNFLLRNLPAGDLTIALVPLKPGPEGMQLPTGSVKMPAEPIQVEGATIVISNPELVPYLTGKSAAQVRDSANQAVLKADLE